MQPWLAVPLGRLLPPLHRPYRPINANLSSLFLSPPAGLDLRPFTKLVSLLGHVKSDNLAPTLRRMPPGLESLCLTTEGGEEPRDFDAGVCVCLCVCVCVFSACVQVLFEVCATACWDSCVLHISLCWWPADS